MDRLEAFHQRLPRLEGYRKTFARATIDHLTGKLSAEDAAARIVKIYEGWIKERIDGVCPNERYDAEIALIYGLIAAFRDFRAGEMDEAALRQRLHAVIDAYTAAEVQPDPELEALAKRTKSLPVMMEPVMGEISWYLQGITNTPLQAHRPGRPRRGLRRGLRPGDRYAPPHLSRRFRGPAGGAGRGGPAARRARKRECLRAYRDPPGKELFGLTQLFEGVPNTVLVIRASFLRYDWIGGRMCLLELFSRMIAWRAFDTGGT